MCSSDLTEAPGGERGVEEPGPANPIRKILRPGPGLLEEVDPLDGKDGRGHRLERMEQQVLQFLDPLREPGRGVGKVDPKLVPNVENGKQVYAQQCAVCHGANGEGLKDEAGRTVYPPLWGERSFNIGAGMARTYTAAAFVMRNMPIGFHEKFPLGQGGLSEQEAVDVAEYFSHQPRPDYPDKVKDWPKDPKPKDSRY